MDWTGPKLVLAVVRAGTLSGAATALGIDHSTAFRRLRSLERSLGTQLFERLPGGSYQATAAGERMALAAERMEDEVLALDRDLAGGDIKLAGWLRVTSSESLAFRLLTPQLKAFRAGYPGIGVELVLDNRLLDLSRREADVAVRTVRPKDGDLWGRKLADIAWGVYGARAYLRRTSSPRLADHAFIGWDENSRRIRVAEWVETMAGPDAITYRTGSLVNQLAAVRSGLGLAALPCYLGDTEPGLMRVGVEPIAELADELWIVTHERLKHTARVRAFFDCVGGGLLGQRDLIAGLRPRSRAGDATRIA
jgi:DNA-binding transcriptional LysR family regulator